MSGVKGNVPVTEECIDYSENNVRQALINAIDKAGGLDWIYPGMKIGIKLNLCLAKKPEAAATTHPVMAAQLCRILTEKGAKVIVGDSPGEPFTAVIMNNVYNQTGMNLCERYGAALNLDFSHHTVTYPEGKTLKSFEYCSWLSECDAIINFSKLKAHGMMGMTAAVKNLYGVVPGTMKSEYHFIHREPSDFADMLVDINEYVKPVLCLCDAVEIMEGNGPTQGTARHLGLLIAGKDPYETDRLCASILNIREEEIPYLNAAKRRGLLSESAGSDLKYVTEKYKIEDFKRSGATCNWFYPDPADPAVRRILKKGLYVIMRSKPVTGENCTGCGRCAKNCPAGAIEIINNKAVIKRNKCVRCFCCQEFCPSGAMHVKRSLVAKIAEK